MEPFRTKKNPVAVRTYGLAWENDLNPGDLLAAVSWTVPSGLSKISEGINATPITDRSGNVYPPATVALIRVSGGAAGRNYRMECHITTVAGDEDGSSLTLMVREQDTRETPC